MKLISACLLGINCRYDGRSKRHDGVISRFAGESLVPICPEQLGGLLTPRERAEQSGNRIITESGKDVTEHFVRGAEEVLRIAREFGATEAILKARSPSCGCGRVYDGTFSGNLIEGDGVTAAILKKNGINVMTEEDVE